MALLLYGSCILKLTLGTLASGKQTWPTQAREWALITASTFGVHWLFPTPHCQITYSSMEHKEFDVGTPGKPRVKKACTEK